MADAQRSLPTDTSIDEVRADWKKDFLDAIVVKKRSRFLLSTALLYMLFHWMLTEGLYANDTVNSYRQQTPLNVTADYSLLGCVATYATEWTFLTPHLLIVRHSQEINMILDHTFTCLLFSFRAIIFTMKYFFYSQYIPSFHFEAFLSFVHMLGMTAALFLMCKDERNLPILAKPPSPRLQN